MVFFQRGDDRRFNDLFKHIEKIDGLQFDLMQFGLRLACRIAQERFQGLEDLVFFFLDPFAFAFDLAFDTLLLHEERFKLIFQHSSLFGDDGIDDEPDFGKGQIVFIQAVFALKVADEVGNPVFEFHDILMFVMVANIPLQLFKIQHAYSYNTILIC